MNRTSLLLALTPCVLAAPQDATITWFHGDLTAAQAHAETQSTAVAIYFWMDGSQFCKDFYAQTLNTPGAAQALDGIACLSADIGTEAGSALLARYGVTQLPSTLFLTPAGEADDVVLGFAQLSTFVSEVARIRAGTRTVSDLRARCAATPSDLAQRLLLSAKLFDVGQSDEAEAILQAIRDSDPTGATVVGARLLLQDARDAVASDASDASDVRTWNLRPLVAHVKAIAPERVRFEGWDLLAQIHMTRGDRKAAFDAWGEALDDAPADRRVDLGFRVMEMAWEAREDLRTRDKRIVLKIAEAAVAQAAIEEEARLEAQAAATDETVTVANSLELLARAQFLNGKRSKALATLDRALALEPNDAVLLARRDELAKR